MPVNRLYFGDNIDVLRENIKEESVDLVYLDPPFNSNATYNLLFRTPKGQESDAQIAAFEDSWRWGEQAEVEFADLLHNGPTNVTELIRSLRGMLGENNMMAYLIMMASRLVELHRALKPQASLYLHCDPTAGHYLKIILDGIFGAEKFRNEITWKRTFAMGTSAGTTAALPITSYFTLKATSTPGTNLSRFSLMRKSPRSIR